MLHCYLRICHPLPGQCHPLPGQPQSLLQRDHPATIISNRQATRAIVIVHTLVKLYHLNRLSRHPSRLHLAVIICPGTKFIVVSTLHVFPVCEIRGPCGFTAMDGHALHTNRIVTVQPAPAYPRLLAAGVVLEEDEEAAGGLGATGRSAPPRGRICGPVPAGGGAATAGGPAGDCTPAGVIAGAALGSVAGGRGMAGGRG